MSPCWDGDQSKGILGPQQTGLGDPAFSGSSIHLPPRRLGLASKDINDGINNDIICRVEFRGLQLCMRVCVCEDLHLHTHRKCLRIFIFHVPRPSFVPPPRAWRDHPYYRQTLLERRQQYFLESQQRKIPRFRGGMPSRQEVPGTDGLVVLTT
jgi:hypothetical protein